MFKHDDYPSVKISILNWYNSVIRLESEKREEVESLAQKFVTSWKQYDDEVNNILAKSDVQHNSITCISRYEGRYIIDLILRNNVTSEAYPEGIYHAHPEYHNIKREAIGLIEAGGMFILPARLKRQLGVVSSCLQKDHFDVNELSEDMLVHQDMIERLIEENGLNHPEDAANNIVKLEIERICRNILFNTAVFKNTEVGKKGFIDFMISNGVYLV